MIILLIPGLLKYGILGVSLAVTIPSISNFLIQIFLVRKLLNIDISTILKILCPPLFSSVVMVLFLYALIQMLTQVVITPFIGLCVLIVLSIYVFRTYPD